MREPGDLQSYSSNGIKSLTAEEQLGAILVYVKDGYTVRLCSYNKQVIGNSQSGNLEFRFAFGQNWVFSVVALKNGSWDLTYIRSTYLPSLEWNVVTIPPNSTARMAHPTVDHNDYKAVCAYYGLQE